MQLQDKQDNVLTTITHTTYILVMFFDRQLSGLRPDIPHPPPPFPSPPPPSRHREYWKMENGQLQPVQRSAPVGAL